MMRKIVIFGTGTAGKAAMDWFRSDSVICFCDNYKTGTFCGLEIISFEHLKEIHEDVLIVIASWDYAKEIENQLKDNGINHYLVWKRDFHSPRLWEAFRLDGYSPITYLANGEWMRYPVMASFLNYSYRGFSSAAIYCYSKYSEPLAVLADAAGLGNKLRGVIGFGEDAVEKFRSLQNEIDCLIVLVSRQDDELYSVYKDSPGITVIDLFDVAPFIPELHCERIKDFKNAYRGKRCFLIGNGPSLKVEDLNKLHENREITFACNKIYLIFQKTDWRPDFYCVSDVVLFDYNRATILNLDLPIKLLSSQLSAFREKAAASKDNRNIKINVTHEVYGENMPRFTKDASVQTFCGNTVLYDLMLQCAAYMGFEEIYILGADNMQSRIIAINELGGLKHFSENYYSEDEIAYLNNIRPELKMRERDVAYQMAEQYSRRNGFRIYNATRGGELEAFERVDFDSLF